MIFLCSRCLGKQHHFQLLHNLHRVSKKLCKLIICQNFSQISTDCENFWHKDSKEKRLFCGVLIFHLTLFMSMHYRDKCRCSELLQNTAIISLQ